MAPIKIAKTETMPPPSWSVSESQLDVATAEAAVVLAQLEAGNFPPQHGAPAALAIPLAAPLGEGAEACLQRGIKALESQEITLALLEFDAAKALAPESELPLFWHQFAQYQQERQALLRAFEYKRTMESLAEKVRDHEMHLALARLYFDFDEPERAQEAANIALLSKKDAP